MYGWNSSIRDKFQDTHFLQLESDVVLGDQAKILVKNNEIIQRFKADPKVVESTCESEIE